VIDVGVLVDKLNSMSCAEIRNYLFVEGIKGLPNDEMSCAIAAWIWRESKETVLVSGMVILAGQRMLPLKKGPIDFVACFDQEKFPELLLDYEDYE
jgi:hypothetical protein